MSNDYKETMNLPQTAFPMKAGLTQSEPKRLEKWQQMDLYHKVVAQNAGHEPYILHDGPPYANGPIHMGHVFNKVLKDIVVKYHSQRGFYSPYVPGWDCHGQPIEHRVEQELGSARMAQIDQPNIRRICREMAEEFVDIQREGFIRLGILAEWENPYLTYAHSYEVGIIELFEQLYAAGAIYRGRKPIHWCPHCHTALAEAEIEYADVQSPSIYVAFKLALTASQQAAFAASGRGALADAWVLIWTTTPWTLPANTGVTLADKADYVLVEFASDHANFGGKRLLVAEQLLEQLVSELGVSSVRPVLADDGSPWKAQGSELVGLEYTHPIDAGLTGRIITGAHVDLATGTGAVHTAPGHGVEDYQVGLEYDLPILMPVDDNGVFDAGGGPFAGLFVEAANPKIIEWLDQRGSLLGSKVIEHSYPHCWRCQNPVIFRATYQWFVSMECNDLRAEALAQIDSIKWYPSWASNRMRAMVLDRPDWCISRQRSWGVPIPIYTCQQCGELVANAETFAAVKDLFEREGSDGWFAHEPAEYLPASIHCEACGAPASQFKPEKDILDVWFESGASHQSVLRQRDYLNFPAELYLEGSDQHRGWFQSSLLTSVGVYHTAPYKGIMSCGFITDGAGYKMSKSRGNVIDPAAVMEEYGADVLRLWVGSIDSSNDVGIDNEIIRRNSESYRRIRNCFRFLLSNVYDFVWERDAVDYEAMLPLDRWILVRLAALLEKVNAGYDEFRFHTVFHVVYDFIIRDLSAVYMDALKDRLYSDGAQSPERRSAQTALVNILEVLVRVLAPILSFTCDEVWDFYPAGLCLPGRVEAVALAGWPEASDFWPQIPTPDAQRLSDDFVTILDVRDAVTKALEESEFSKSQQAALLITAPAAIIEVLDRQDERLLPELFIVSAVELHVGAGPELVVEVQAAAGQKCPRCWNYRELESGLDGEQQEVCPRCAAVLAGLGR